LPEKKGKPYNMNVLKNLKIKFKLSLAFGLTTLILISLSGCVVYILNEIDKQGNDITESMKLSDALNEAKYNLTWDKQLVMEVLASENKEEVSEQLRNHAEAIKGFDENINIIQQVGGNKEWGNKYDPIKTKVVKIAEGLDEQHNTKLTPLFERLQSQKLDLLTLQENTKAILESKNEEEIAVHNQKLEALGNELSLTDHTFDDLANAINEKLLNTESDIAVIVEGSAKNTDELVAISISGIAITSVISILISIFIGIAITQSIAGPLKSAATLAEKIANGDLTSSIDLDQKDEVGDLAKSLRKMVVKLQEVIGFIINASENISTASNQMSSSSQLMSEGATEQASSVEEISSSMEEMAANIQQNTNNSKQTEKIARNAAKDVTESNEAVAKTVDSMKTIANKISIIGEISRQTNLLALNAAVEAARAGEHGKGFAVVAAEVRKLAERSQLAATEINEVSSTSVDIAQKSGELLNSVVPNIQKTSDLVAEISASSIEQNAGADQVNNAIQQLNQVVQENAATAEEMAAGAEELNAQAESLKEMVQFFKIETNRSHVMNQKMDVQSKRKIKTFSPKGNPLKRAELKLNLNTEPAHADSEYETF
jgi:methyl-accepting chemotaxis protein